MFKRNKSRNQKHEQRTEIPPKQSGNLKKNHTDHVEMNNENEKLAGQAKQQTGYR